MMNTSSYHIWANPIYQKLFQYITYERENFAHDRAEQIALPQEQDPPSILDYEPGDDDATKNAQSNLVKVALYPGYFRMKDILCKDFTQANDFKGKGEEDCGQFRPKEEPS